MCKNILWTGATKMKKISLSKTDGKTRNSSWPKVTTRLSNMAVLLLWASEWVIWLSCILPDEDQTIGRDSKKKKKKKARGQRNVESNLVWILSVWLEFPRGIIDRHTPKFLQMERVTEQHSTERKNVNTRQSSEMSDIIQKPQCIR